MDTNPPLDEELRKKFEEALEEANKNSLYRKIGYGKFVRFDSRSDTRDAHVIFHDSSGLVRRIMNRNVQGALRLLPFSMMDKVQLWERIKDGEIFATNLEEVPEG